MKSSTITLAVTLALSSSSSVSSMPHYLDSVADASLSARAPAYFVKRSLLESQSFDEEPNALLKRGNEKIKSSSLSSQNDNKDDNDDQAEDDDCEDDESSDSEDAVHDPTEQYYKIGSNSSTGVRIPKSSSTQSNSNKPPPAQAPALEEKKQDYQKSKTTEQPNYEKPETSKQPSYEKPETSKQWSQPPVDPVKVQKTYSHKESSSSQSSSYSSSHQHYGESGGKSPEPVGSHSGYSGKATFFTQDGNAGACGKTHQDSDYIVAIQSGMYGGGTFCGKTIVVTRVSTGQSIECVAADECPGCPSTYSLDLSTGAFNALGNAQEGLFDILWHVKE
ncbi:hypothetical protein MJO28_004895 [Puccinia striiformis f. sp. tritici]|uniref:RlpA-like protein double-psi beta-barrel domain-containing protein n=5 Tax=Puccinia striiformis TaxID=27350 RepID=A0A0L0UTF1_9BASI|nr:hypothetical protein Pst134EA_009105 [Puccinia striiformis f. sp. tritici]AOS49612.1 PNPi effector [Puccinia striiformis f. sp. hordei]KAI9617742.1 hypothetical protein KEM48_007024 [Puccinia striiformis f. sp. tritici PST-130]KNE90328.1 hypothetical protein PSTG_16231 [Puccinia striiformis f. sp. tritici PST-78]POW14327.1 hypothetical protein PSTT_03051 [Puccinia striiformis]AOS49611.1 PNPi effector [Puccinia striiformis f. sp. tritici]